MKNAKDSLYDAMFTVMDGCKKLDNVVKKLKYGINNHDNTIIDINTKLKKLTSEFKSIK